MLSAARRIQGRWWLLLLLASLVLAACGGEPDPIVVYVTPTQVSTNTPTGQENSPLIMVYQPSAPDPGAGSAAIAYLQATTQASPTPGSYGPIVSPDNAAAPSPTTPPENTPKPTRRPTRTPTEAPAKLTPTPSPTSTLAGTPLPTLDADRMGIQINTDLSDDDFYLSLMFAQELGIKWVKFQFAWDLLEEQPGVLTQTLYRYRLFVQRADRDGFKVMVSIAKAPGWSRNTLDENGPPRDPQILANFLSTMLGEVRVDLFGQSYIDAIEIWNEPNLRREWNGGTLTGQDYMRYFDAAYNAIRAAEGGSSITIITAGLAPTGVNDGVSATDDRVYLNQMYQAGLGSTKYQNIAIGVHPYGSWNAPDARCCTNSGQGYDVHPTFFFLDNIEDYRAIMEQNGDTTRQLWATEFGWGTYEGLVLEDGSPAPAPDGHP
ncbi:MAG: cellulase family glycosylhydrolase, partial [Anaerolineae bacterium]|nr:cellulase family glycosylhydrolase [Anaerolineae bacterium]